MKSDNLQIRNSTAEFLIFSYQQGADGVAVRVQDGTVWLSQKGIGHLFDTTPENVLMHLKNIFKASELQDDSVTKKFLVTAADGKNYQVKHYNLDAIIAVGYRVNSTRATDFRKWATTILREFTLRGSHAYGTAMPDSDIDIRGCAFNSKAEMIGMSKFEQIVETNTDTTIYSFNKLINLLLNTNPNTIEMLGCKPEHYLIFSPVAQELIENRKIFLSRRAAQSFGSYANQHY